MDSFGLRAKFLQDGLLDNVDFVNSITEESIEDTHWTLCRSYTVRSHVIEEEFDIQLSDGDKSPHVECALKVTVRSKDAPQDDTREKIFKPRRWFGPDLEVEVVDQHISPGRLSAETSPGSSLLSSASLSQESIGRRGLPAETSPGSSSLSSVSLRQESIGRRATPSTMQGGHQFHLNLNPFNIIEIEVTCINSINPT